MAALGLESYRFSIAWPRVQPTGAGRVNAARARLLPPAGRGPARARDRADRDALPLGPAAGAAGRRRLGGARHRRSASPSTRRSWPTSSATWSRSWITHNEPWVVAFLGHADGTKAPGIRDWPTALRVVAPPAALARAGAAGAARAAGRAGAGRDRAEPVARSTPRRRRRGRPRRRAADGRPPEPLVPGPGAARQLPGRHARALRAALYGPLGRRSATATCDVIARADRLPRRQLLQPAARRRRARRRCRCRPASAAPPPPTTAMGWEVDPDGLHELLMRLRRDYGAAADLHHRERRRLRRRRRRSTAASRTRERVAYLRGHLAALARAVADGVDVRRYCVWSLLDNFEWEHGYDKRFGIVHVDYATQARVPKRSALWYRDFIARVRDGRRKLMARLAFEGVTKVFADGTEAVDATSTSTIARRRASRSSSARRARASRPRCGWSPGSRTPRRARSASATAWSTTSRPRTATSRWSSRATRSIRTWTWRATWASR